MRTRMELGVVLASTPGIAAAGLAASFGEIEIQLFRFRPARLEVPAGSQVRWTNRDDVVHTITAGTPDAPQPAFRLILEGRGTTVGQTFAERGVFPYLCERHPHMRGAISVP